MIPVILVTLGFVLTMMYFRAETKSKTLSPQMYPLKNLESMLEYGLSEPEYDDL